MCYDDKTSFTACKYTHSKWHIVIHAVSPERAVCIYFYFDFTIYFSDSSKQRQKIRLKITKDKCELKESLSKYNILSEEPLNVQDVMEGKFPWKECFPSSDKCKYLFLF